MAENDRPIRETHAAVVDRLRSSGFDRDQARKLADDSLRRVDPKIERGTNQRPPKS